MNTKFIRSNNETILEIIPTTETEKVIISEMQEIYKSNSRNLIKLIIENEVVKVVNTDAIEGKFLSENGWKRLKAFYGSDIINNLLIWIKIHKGFLMILKGSMFQYRIYKMIDYPNENNLTPERLVEIVNEAEFCDYKNLVHIPGYGNVARFYNKNLNSVISVYPIENKGKIRSIYEYRGYFK
jgi:hypothetical protein